MNIIMKANKECGKFSSNGNLFDDGWLSRVKTAEESDEEVLYYCGPVKTSHKGVFLAKLEILTK